MFREFKSGACLPFVAVVIATLGIRIVEAQTYAGAERTSAALGHYARARALLVEALAEFEAGRKIAKPDLLLNPEEWRLSLITRTEELNRVLDPQPRVTRSGVRFKANGLQVKHAHEQLPPVFDGAKATNTYSEEVRKLEFKENELRGGARQNVSRADTIRALESELNEFLKPEELPASSAALSRSPVGVEPKHHSSSPREAISRPVQPAEPPLVERTPLEREGSPAVNQMLGSKVDSRSFQPSQDAKPSKPEESGRLASGGDVVGSVTPRVSSVGDSSDAELERLVDEAIDSRLKQKQAERLKEAELRE